MAKVIRNCIGFHLLRSVIGLKNTRHFLNQSDAKLLPITTWLPAFAQALGSLSLKVIFFLLIGRRDNFYFSFSTVKQQAL